MSGQPKKEITDKDLTPYHRERNKRTAEANKKMPKVTREEFQRQAQALRDFRKAHEEEKAKLAKNNQEPINFNSPMQQRVFEKMGTRLRVSKPDNLELTD